jgi:hypothetical protein
MVDRGAFSPREYLQIYLTSPHGRQHGGLSNCWRVEPNYRAGDFAVPAFEAWGMIIEESRVVRATDAAVVS